MDVRRGQLAELGGLIAAHARPDMQTSINGLMLSKEVASGLPDYSLTEPLVVVMAQGGKRLLLGEDRYEYRAGQCLVVTADLPVTGRFIDAGDGLPSLGMALVLRPAVVAELVLQAPGVRAARGAGSTAMFTTDADADLLDAVIRLVRLLDKPSDAPILAPLIEREIVWRLLAGPYGDTVRQIGMADSNLSYVSRAIGWIRQNYAEPMRVEELARVAGMSPSTFHRHFRSVTAMSPLQFQKRIRLQEARSMLVAAPGDIAGVGHRVGYDSPSQFTREYRRLFGAPPGLDAQRLRA
ncbi:AraC family transcriptional regulator [Mycolicibacterium aichiense]|uniref:AraC family transcriptional regulator n=1 Tax=Mycolicibacterium aichiense TaxID=1799 RepID=A0AAD1HP99_9MYCO|nr:AraC family transcriptional regulator [Mycolicibacterium aichiense]MCV7018838.1 AraC family transcriptional regulator [Mycolicibacterium aichiense]BBX08621.1 AraC family transcriptional regulator [Mycolicibacterium aichiense]STZ82417.1 AraC family transcriptional regulator [Mycolicibacterium aichiense]